MTKLALMSQTILIIFIVSMNLAKWIFLINRWLGLFAYIFGKFFPYFSNRLDNYPIDWKIFFSFKLWRKCGWKKSNSGWMFFKNFSNQLDQKKFCWIIFKDFFQPVGKKSLKIGSGWIIRLDQFTWLEKKISVG